MKQGFGTVIKRRRRSISFNSYFEGVQTNEKSNGRSACSGWNDGMARRLGNYIENFRTDFTGMVTLTYPAEYPHDGEIVKMQWRAFIERLRRTEWFAQNSLVWFLEFQDRGAPHFHFLTTGWIAKDWVAQNWADITNGDWRACSRTEALKNPDSAGAYARKYATKSEQKTIPIEFEHIGRMWGCSGNKICKGMPRQPVVVATSKGAHPSKMKYLIEFIVSATKCRMAETRSGMVIYGTVRQIMEVWSWLEAHAAITVLTDNFRAGSMQLQPVE